MQFRVLGRDACKLLGPVKLLLFLLAKASAKRWEKIGITPDTRLLPPKNRVFVSSRPRTRSIWCVAFVSFSNGATQDVLMHTQVHSCLKAECICICIHAAVYCHIHISPYIHRRTATCCKDWCGHCGSGTVCEYNVLLCPQLQYNTSQKPMSRPG